MTEIDSNWKQVITIETYYLVDYENVHNEGLEGLKNLGSTDHVFVFFTNNAFRIDMRYTSGLKSAEFKSIEVPAGKQSADMHIASYLGYLIGKNPNKKINIVIISKDRDYNNLVGFWGKDADVSQREKIDSAKKKLNSNEVSGKNNHKCTNKPHQNNAQKMNQKRPKKDIRNKNQLIDEIKKALKEMGHLNYTVDLVVSIAEDCYKKDNFKIEFLNRIVKTYNENHEIYIKITHILDEYS